MNKVGLVEHLVHWMSLAYVLLKHCLRAHTKKSHSTPTPVLAKTLQKVEIEQRMQFILPKTKKQKKRIRLGISNHSKLFNFQQLDNKQKHDCKNMKGFYNIRRHRVLV